MKPPKSEIIHFRISFKMKALIEKAAAVSGQSLTDFAARSLVEAANELLEREHLTTLSNRDRDRLLAILDANDKPNEALRRAAKIHKQMIVE